MYICIYYIYKLHIYDTLSVDRHVIICIYLVFFYLGAKMGPECCRKFFFVCINRENPQTLGEKGSASLFFCHWLQSAALENDRCLVHFFNFPLIALQSSSSSRTSDGQSSLADKCCSPLQIREALQSNSPLPCVMGFKLYFVYVDIT